MTSHDWELSAACREVDAELWFPSKGESPERALAICWTCPVRTACLDAALEEERRIRGGRHGVRGGLTAEDRAQLQRRRTIAAGRARTATPTKS